MQIYHLRIISFPFVSSSCLKRRYVGHPKIVVMENKKSQRGSPPKKKNSDHLRDWHQELTKHQLVGAGPQVVINLKGLAEEHLGLGAGVFGNSWSSLGAANLENGLELR